MANYHMKKCLISLVIRTMQVETTIPYHYTLLKWLQKLKITKGLLELSLIHCGWECRRV